MGKKILKILNNLPIFWQKSTFKLAYWQLAIGFWQLAVGSWLLAIGFLFSIEFLPYFYCISTVFPPYILSLFRFALYALRYSLRCLSTISITSSGSNLDETPIGEPMISPRPPQVGEPPFSFSF